MKILIFLAGILFGFLPGFAAGQDLDESSKVIFQAMEEELHRSQTQLKIDVFDPPYFINYQIRHHDHAEVLGSFGALIDSKIADNRTLFVEVRVGDPQFDSFTPGSHRHALKQFIPVDNDLVALKRALWYETDLRYKQAIMNFLKKKGRFISGLENHELADFSPGGNAPRVEIQPVPPFEPDIERWEGLVREVSGLFRAEPSIEKSQVKIFSDRVIRYYYDSEKVKVRSADLQFGVIVEAWTKTESGSPIHDQETLLFTDLKIFPSEGDLKEKTVQLIEGMKNLQKGPKIDPFVGPAIFSPDAAAVLFHEAIGHRLEGDRLRTANDGKTFMKKVGQRILPAFLTVVDNPTLQRFKGQDLLGHYKIDDEGQESEEVVLIDRGVLKSFLLSRAPVLGFSKTNGHARSDGLRLPMSRMSNFIVQSKNQLAADQLKQALIDLIKKQGKPYGFYVKKIMGGETQTDASNFQVFKGKPLYLYKVYPEDGREELVRGVEFVGTPLSIISKVIATGDDETAINGFCGAESGFLPVTSITPSVLLSEVELQNANEQRLRQPILPPPNL